MEVISREISYKTLEGEEKIIKYDIVKVDPKHYTYKIKFTKEIEEEEVKFEGILHEDTGKLKKGKVSFANGDF